MPRSNVKLYIYVSLLLPPSSFADAELRFCGLPAIVFAAVYKLKSPYGSVALYITLFYRLDQLSRQMMGKIELDSDYSIDKQHFWEFYRRMKRRTRRRKTRPLRQITTTDKSEPATYLTK